MRKINFLPIMLLVLLVGCVHPGTNYSQSDSALALSQQYQALEDTYKSQYTAAGEKEREWLKTEVAPVLDHARQRLIQYNQFVLEGETEEAETQRLMMIRLLRQINNKLMLEK